MKNAQISLSQVAATFTAANSAYIARSGAGAKLNSKGFQSDIASGLNLFSRFTDAQWADLSSLNVDFLPSAEKTKNVKTLKRLPSLLLFAIAGDVRDLKGSARTCALEVCALLYGAKSREALHFSATGKGNENTSDQIDTAKARKVMRVMGAIGASTEPTQNSVSFAAGNLGDVLNIAHKDKRNGLPVVNEKSPLVMRIVKRIEELTESQIAELKGEDTPAVKAPRVRKARAAK